MENTLGNIRLEATFKITKVLSMKISAEPNEHGKAEIKAILDKTDTDSVISAKQESIKIKDGDELLFSGVIDKVSLHHSNGANTITIQAITHSIKLDIKKKSHSFQNKTAPYTKLFDTVIKEGYDGDYADKLTGGASQGRVFIQYDETDWEFLKRVCSVLGGVLISDLLGDTPRVYIGIPSPNTGTEDGSDCDTEKDLNQYDITKQNYDEKPQLSHVALQIKSMVNYELGTDISYQDKTLTAFKKEIAVSEGELEKTYSIKSRDGIYANLIKNNNLTGLSIDGTVLDVTSDTVKVHLDIDEQQDVGEANWFKVSTFYASNGQTGFYFMPQVGDSVKLYLPEANENEAFILCANRTDGAENPKTQDVNTKYLSNNYGKEIKMAPNELQITAVSGGAMEIKMTDQSGIEIISNGEMNITSGEDIVFKGDRATMTAKESIRATANFSSQTLDNITHFKAAHITMNGTVKNHMELATPLKQNGDLGASTDITAIPLRKLETNISPQTLQFVEGQAIGSVEFTDKLTTKSVATLKIDGIDSGVRYPIYNDASGKGSYIIIYNGIKVYMKDCILLNEIPIVVEEGGNRYFIYNFSISSDKLNLITKSMANLRIDGVDGVESTKRYLINDAVDDKGRYIILDNGTTVYLKDCTVLNEIPTVVVDVKEGNRYFITDYSMLSNVLLIMTTVAKFFVNKGFTDIQTAGIMGNMQLETEDTWNPLFRTDTPWGLVQFIDLRFDLENAYKAAGLDKDVYGYDGLSIYQGYSGQNKILVSDLKTILRTQLDFIYQSKPTGADWISTLKTSNNVDEAAEIFLVCFEGATYLDIPQIEANLLKYYYVGKYYEDAASRRKDAEECLSYFPKWKDGGWI